MTKKKMSPEQAEKLACLFVRGFGAFGFSFFASLAIAQGDWGVFFITISIMTAVLFGLSLMVNFEKVAEGFQALMAESAKRQKGNWSKQLGLDPVTLANEHIARMNDTTNNPAYHSMLGNIYHRNN